jgi:glutathione S-transferase
MCRYVGRMAGLYPADDMQALYCDEVLDAQEDLAHYIVPTFGLKGDELRLAREKLVNGWMSVYLRGLEQLLTRGGGKYFANDEMTMADLKTFIQTRWLCSGTLDHVPTDLVQRLAPGLVEHRQRVETDPRVVAYYASRRQ